MDKCLVCKFYEIETNACMGECRANKEESNTNNIIGGDKMDYRIILKKYIEHVGNLEGVDFIEERDRDNSSIKFTDAEWNELMNISNEPHDENITI